MTHWRDLGHHEGCKPMINLWLMEPEGQIYTSLPGHWLLPVPWQVLLEGPIYFAIIATLMALFVSFDGCTHTNKFSAFRCTKYCPNWYCRREVMKPWKCALVEVSKHTSVCAWVLTILCLGVGTSPNIALIVRLITSNYLINGLTLPWAWFQHWTILVRLGDQVLAIIPPHRLYFASIPPLGRNY